MGGGKLVPIFDGNKNRGRTLHWICFWLFSNEWTLIHVWWPWLWIGGGWRLLGCNFFRLLKKLRFRDWDSKYVVFESAFCGCCCDLLLFFLHLLNLVFCKMQIVLLFCFPLQPQKICVNIVADAPFLSNTFMVGAIGGGECTDIFRILTSFNHNRWLRYRWLYYNPGVLNSPAKQRLSGWRLWHTQRNGDCKSKKHVPLSRRFYLFNLRFQWWNSVSQIHRLFFWIRCFGWAASERNLVKIKGLPRWKLSHHVTMSQPFLRQHVWAQWWGRRWEMLWCWPWKTAKSLWEKNHGSL